MSSYLYADRFIGNSGQVFVARNHTGAFSYDHWIRLENIEDVLMCIPPAEGDPTPHLA